MLKNFKPISLILLAGATCFPASIFAETMPSKQSMNISSRVEKSQVLWKMIWALLPEHRS